LVRAPGSYPEAPWFESRRAHSSMRARTRVGVVVNVAWGSAILSALHVLAFGLGLGGVWSRGRAMRAGDVERVLAADSAWGLAALLWIGTGLARLLGPFEKGVWWYLGNPLFHLKLTLFGLVLLLEIWPMVTLIRWRIARGRGLPVDTSVLPRLAVVNSLELTLVVIIPFVAAAMARGLWPT
jgi:putative membrane protein